MQSRISALLFVVLVLLGIASCGGGDEEILGPGTVLKAENLVPEVQVQSVDHRYRIAGYSDVSLDVDPIVALIGSAQSSLDIAISRLNRQLVVDALVAEAQSGTRIRIVTEREFFDDPTYKPFYSQLLVTANTGGNITVHTDDDGMPRIMHSRFMIIDNVQVITGSYNWETEASEHTFGDLIKILSADVAGAFTNQFNQMFLEGNFGVHKRDETQHVFLLGQGNGQLEVYFGPTDQPREIMSSNISNSQTCLFAVEQFKDVGLANTLLGFASNPNNTLFSYFTDIGAQGDAEENAVYDAFVNLAETGDGIGSLYVSLPIDYENGIFNDYNVMNHKLMLCSNSTAGGPGIVFYTGNYSELAFTLNDEVMLVMSQPAMVDKYFRLGGFSQGGSIFNQSLPLATLTDGEDLQELDSVMLMHPFLTSPEAAPYRPFDSVATGLVFGTIDNFRPTITIQITDGEFEDVDIDVVFEIEGEYFFSGTINPTRPFGGDDDAFVRSELINPDHRFMIVVPAGEIIIRSIVTDLDGGPSALFQPSEKSITIGPGCVREITLNINQASDGSDTGGLGV